MATSRTSGGRTKTGSRGGRTATPAARRTLPDILTLPEAAEFLRVPPEEIERLAAEGTLPGRRLAGEWRFLKSAIEDWLRRPEGTDASTAIHALAGAFSDDPDLDRIVADAYRDRSGRSDKVPR